MSVTCPRCKGPAPDEYGHAWTVCLINLAERIDALESAQSAAAQRGAGRDVPGGSRELAPGWRKSDGTPRCNRCKRAGAEYFLDLLGNYLASCSACAESMGVFAPATPAPAESPSEAAPGDVAWVGYEKRHKDGSHCNAAFPAECGRAHLVSLPVAAAPSGAPKVCEPWCGTKEGPEIGTSSWWAANRRYFCSPACRDAGRPVNAAIDRAKLDALAAEGRALGRELSDRMKGVRPVNAAGGGTNRRAEFYATVDAVGDLPSSGLATSSDPQPAASPAPCPGCGRAIEQDAVDHGCRVVTEAGVRVVRCSVSGKVYPAPSPPTDPTPSGAVAPVTSEEARTLAANFRQEMNGARPHWHESLDRYIRERESVEAALRAELDEWAALAGREGRRALKAENERDALRAELAQIKADRAAPAGTAPARTWKNRERACAFNSCESLDGPHNEKCDDLTAVLDDVARTAEARGRDATLRDAAEWKADSDWLKVIEGTSRITCDCGAKWTFAPKHPDIPEVAAWRALSDAERQLVYGAVGSEVSRYDIARRVLEALAGSPKKEGT